MEENKHYGLGVMLGCLTGNENSVNTLRGALGKTIQALTLDHDSPALHFVFRDGSKLKLYDDGQSCCEDRYMRTDDDLSASIGAQLLTVEVRDAPDQEDEYGKHEVQFLVITTSAGILTLSSHNEHNGYYGGFLIRADAE